MQAVPFSPCGAILASPKELSPKLSTENSNTRNAITKARKDESTKETIEEKPGRLALCFFRVFALSCFRDGISRDAMPFNADPFVRRA
jgi:hypothetical protein